MIHAKPHPYGVRDIHVVAKGATVRPATVHHVSNPGAQRCRFLLVQGVGKYDFVKAD